MIAILVILTLGFLPAFVEILAEIIRKKNGKQEPPFYDDEDTYIG